MPTSRSKPSEVISLEPILSDKSKWIIVTKSRGVPHFHTLTKVGNDWNCTCVGFVMRKMCSHVEAIKEKMK